MSWPGFRRCGKFNAQAVVIDGHHFASKAEAARYRVLKLMEKSGAIYNLELQPRFELQGKFLQDGVIHRAITYVADFSYQQMGTAGIIVEDVKGFQTEVWKIKAKLFQFKYPNMKLVIP